MSEQTEALNFGPQWIRDLSNGTSVSVPPPSPGPSYKLAQYRYGKEEMLALFSKDLKPPEINKDVADFILKEHVHDPLALMPMTEEEQRNSFGSLNSMAVLKMMGRGGQRGGRGASRGGRGSGRGRAGEPGFYRGFSQDDSTSTKTEDGWQRDRKHSWGENTGRGGFGDRTSAKDIETSPRGFESTAPPGRHGRALASRDWRSSESGEADDDGGGWMTSGSRGSERAERWRTSSRDSWSREDHPRGERGDSWNQGWNRSGDRDRNSFEDLPEWSKADNVFEPDSGSFDDTGAFRVAKDKKPPDDDGPKTSLDHEQKEDWDLEIADNNHDDKTDSDSTTRDSDTPQNKELQRNGTTENVKLKDPNAKDIQQQANVKNVNSPTKDNSPVMEEKAPGIAEKQSPVISPREEHNSRAEVLHQDEVGANLERVAESCIANLDVESEEPAEERLSSSLESSSGQRSISLEDTKWFYRDPQGQEQGPFSNEEMVEWFHHGYFTMQLSVRRHCDGIYLTLGDLIKRWKRVPFMPGPCPPPITPQQVMNEQAMFVQQQLLQQHYQHLQKQAMLQQIQQQRHLQQEQRQQAAESALQLNFPSGPENQARSLRTVVSPRSLPTTTHSGSPVGAAEMIWGPEPQPTKDSWSPTGKTSPWNEPKSQTSPVPTVEEIQRREREKEIEREKEREREEAEKKEAELLALRQKEEEEKRELAKKQEEERLKREAIEKAEEERRNQEEAKVKQNAAEENEAMTSERDPEEASKWVRKQSSQRLQRQRRLIQQQMKEKEEKKQEEEKMKRQEEERLKEELRRKEESDQRRKSQKAETENRKQKESRKKHNTSEEEQNMKEEQPRQHLTAELFRQANMTSIHQRGEEAEMRQRQEEESNGASRWGSQNTAAMSLSEIQEQEEKNRRTHEEKMKELEARQRQLQSAAQAHGWSEKSQTSSGVRSLKAIQDEQAKQPSKQNKQSPRSQPTQASASPAWSNSWTAGNNNVWTGNHNDREEQETEFWDDVMRVAPPNTGKNQTQTQKVNTTKQPKQQSTTKPVTNGKKSAKKITKEEESVRRIFQETVSSDPFTEWCTQSLHGIATAVDVPTFIAFLQDLESPYEVHTYVREYIGDSSEAKSFAKEFIERRGSSEWKHVPTKSTSSPSTKQSSGVVARGGGGAARSEPESKEGSGGKAKKKKKQRMQKVDPSILGFSVNAAERVNMGEIQSVEDS